MGRHTTAGITPTSVAPNTSVGTTAQRPTLGASQLGITYFNIDVNQLEIWNGSYWFVVGEFPNVAISTSQTLGSNHAYWVNTTGGAVTLALPTTPRQGDYIKITDSHGQFNTNACTINNNGNPIMRTNDTMTINTAGASLALVYFDATRGWLLEAI
jgi:hypothetical protein